MDGVQPEMYLRFRTETHPNGTNAPPIATRRARGGRGQVENTPVDVSRTAPSRSGMRYRTRKRLTKSPPGQRGEETQIRLSAIHTSERRRLPSSVYRDRIASRGLIRVARRAGIYVASMDTAKNSSAIPAKVGGSAVLT